MDAIDLSHSSFWEGKTPVLMGASKGSVYPRDLENWVRGREKLRGKLIFSSSGTTGSEKFIILDKKQFLEAACAINQQWSIGSKDRFGLWLPITHAGGAGLIARAYIAGATLFDWSNSPWDCQNLVRFCHKQGVTIVSLVPTQLVDCIKQGLEAPKDLRIVWVGGAKLEVGLKQKAKLLGWPVVETYGMTETCTQIASENLTAGGMKVFPHWEVSLSRKGKLRLRGKALLDGYIVGKGNVWSIVDPKVEGWFETQDLVDIRGGELVFLARSDCIVKILGEKVDLGEVEKKFKNYFPEDLRESNRLAIVNLPEIRRGNCLFPVWEDESLPESILRAREVFNQEYGGLWQLEDFRVVEFIPRSDLGKVKYTELRNKLENSFS